MSKVTFASRLTDYELSAFVERAGAADLALLELERITRDTGAEVTFKDVRKSVALLNQMVCQESAARCSGEVTFPRITSASQDERLAAWHKDRTWPHDGY